MRALRGLVSLRLLSLGLAAAGGIAGCSDAPSGTAPPPPGTTTAPPKPVTPGAPAAPGAPATPAAPVAKKPVAPVVKESVLAEARKRTLTKDDFSESDSNRDPFRSFLSSFAVQIVTHTQHPIILEKFALDELHLAGVVTGELQPRAMFVDPSGQGVIVVRGDHVSKVDALVTRIAPDRVYLRIEEQGSTGPDKPHVTERQIELHAGELPAQ